jgi:hypothetical protein
MPIIHNIYIFYATNLQIFFYPPKNHSIISMAIAAQASASAKAW